MCCVELLCCAVIVIAIVVMDIVVVVVVAMNVLIAVMIDNGGVCSWSCSCYVLPVFFVDANRERCAQLKLV